MTTASQTEADDWIADVLRPGDLVVVAQGAGEPTPLLEQLVRSGHTVPGLEVFVGLSHSDVLRQPAARGLSFASFGAMGPLGRLAADGAVAVLPCNFSDVPRLLELRAPERIVVVVQVSEADADGFHSLGLAVDYTFELITRARAVVAEINDQLPVTSAPRLHRSTFTARVATSRPVPEVKTDSANDVQHRIARNVASLVEDGVTLQLGVGALPSVVVSAICGRRDLRVHSTLAGSWLHELAESDALSSDPGAVMISEAAGSQALYDYVATSSVQVRPVSELMRPETLAGIPGFVAMNSALQVDLSGQVNAEALATGYVGGVGGQPEFLRAAQRSPGGRSIVMLASTAVDGSQSRIVRRLHEGAVTTPRSGVDFIVTEYGIADLRGRSIVERADALVGVAAPQHRDSLRAAP